MILLKGVVGILLFILTSLTIYMAWINLTPGHYQRYGCCSFEYLTEKQLEEKELAFRGVGCIGVLCQPNALQQLGLYLEDFDFSK